ncbi:MAG TPA: ABC transporter ATP-binding protein [Candidatus Angelobacter sp.]|nr:ABC transporter ATP-binding protein [Candidatus Angelobacter sp.]
MSRPPALEFDNITKEYRGFFKSESVKALDGFSLRVEPGEIFGFLGPNGAGKTTAIHIALGFLHSTKGKGSMLGHPFGHPGIRRRVGFLAENIALYHRPAARLVRFYGALNGMNGSDLRRRTREIFAELNLQNVAERNTARLSRGMLQRVGLAQALVNNPDLLILDEPTSALDPLGRIAVRDILKRFRQEGKTVFLSSHMLSEAEQICDRLAIVVRGRVKRVGSIPELLESQERFVITATGIDALMFPGSQQNGHIKITVPALEQRRMIEQIWLAGGEVIAVNPVRRTLEDLFVELAHQNGGGKQKDKGDS